MMNEENGMSSVQTTVGRRIAQEEQTDRPAGKKTGLIIGIVAGALVLGYAALCVVAQTVYGHRAFPNTTVLGLDVSGMSAQQAEHLWQEKGTAVLENTVIDLTRQSYILGEVTLAELGAEVKPLYVSRAAGCDSAGGGVLDVARSGWDYLHSLIGGVSAVPQIDVSGDKLERACETLADTVDCTVVDGGYRLEDGQGLYITKPQNGERLDSTALKTALEQHLERRDLSAIECTYKEQAAAPLDLQAIHDELEGQVVSAVCDKATGKPTQSHVGVAFDVEKVQAQLDSAAPGTEFLAEAEVAFPSVTTEELETAMFRDVLGTSTTKCAGPWGRHQNIRLAARAINGRIYNPGEAFWYNATVGERTEERGYQPAAAYSGGKTVTSIGGGICQVSSTLYYCAMVSNLKINTRTCHYFPVAYIEPGMDATVSWGGPEFKFTNNRDYPIEIKAYVQNGSVTVEIWGTDVDGSYVKMSYTANGLRATTYRTVYDKDGNQISHTLEANSTYHSHDTTPKPTPTPSTKPAPTPTPTSKPQPTPYPSVYDPGDAGED